MPVVEYNAEPDKYANLTEEREIYVSEPCGDHTAENSTVPQVGAGVPLLVRLREILPLVSTESAPSTRLTKREEWARRDTQVVSMEITPSTRLTKREEWARLVSNIRDTLAELFLDLADSKLIVNDTGIDSRYIFFESSAINRWGEIVAQAITEGKLDKLFQVALDRYKENPALQDVYKKYLALKAASAPLSPIMMIKNAKAERRATIELRIEGDYSNFLPEDQEKLLRSIHNLLGLGNKPDIRITHVGQGSVIISIEASQDVVVELYHKLKSLDKLEAYNLKGVSLRKIDLSKANLQKVNFEDADLENANLRQANLSEAILVRANLVGAQLHDAKLTNANLAGADLTETDLQGADLFGTNLSEAILNRTKYNINTIWPAGFDHATHELIYVETKGEDE